MGKLIGNQRYRDLLLGVALLSCTLVLLYFPSQGVEAAQDGLRLCANVIIPSLFPFFVLSSLVVELGLSRYLGNALEGLMLPLFRVSGVCASALALGFVGGYPVGARTAISLYESGQCSKTEAERLLAFCNNSGPAFIFGVVGAGVFANSMAGLLLYCAHITASFLVGILFRFYRYNEPVPTRKRQVSVHTVSFSSAFTRSVTGALSATLNICAFVLFFTVTIRILFLTGLMDWFTHCCSALLYPLGFSETWTKQLLTGAIELSSGVSGLTSGGTDCQRLSLAAFMLGWAGLSVHCQVLAFLGDSNLSMKTYFWGKLLHGGISAALTALFFTWFPLSKPVSAYLTQQVETMAGLDFQRALSISLGTSIGVWFVLIWLVLWILKNNSGKSI